MIIIFVILLDSYRFCFSMGKISERTMENTGWTCLFHHAVMRVTLYDVKYPIYTIYSILPQKYTLFRKNCFVLNEMFLPNASNSFRFLVSNNSVTIFLAFRWNISSIINLPFLLKMDRICTIILLQIKEDLEKTHFRFLETRHITMLHCVFNSWI